MCAPCALESKKGYDRMCENGSRVELVKAFKLAVHFRVPSVSSVSRESSYLGARRNFVRMRPLISLYLCPAWKWDLSFSHHCY